MLPVMNQRTRKQFNLALAHRQVERILCNILLLKEQLLMMLTFRTGYQI